MVVIIRQADCLSYIGGIIKFHAQYFVELGLFKYYTDDSEVSRPLADTVFNPIREA